MDFSSLQDYAVSFIYENQISSYNLYCSQTQKCGYYVHFILFFLGISPISYYLVDILERGDVALDPKWSAVGVGIIETIGM